MPDTQKQGKKQGSGIIKMVVAAIAIIVVGFVIYAFVNFGNIVKVQTERIGSKTLGVPVNIGAMDLSLTDRKVTVGNLKIGNPKGFKKPNALTIEQILVQLGELSKELIVFDRIAIDGANVTFEANRNGTNFSALKKNLPQKDAAKEPASPEEQIKVIVRDFRLNGAQLKPAVLLIDQSKLSTVNVPDIRLQGIGEKEKGILAREALAQIFAHISQRFNSAAGQAGFLTGLSPDVLKGMEIDPGRIKDLSGALEGGVQEKMKEQTDKIRSGVEKMGSDIEGQVKGLFGN